MLVTTDDVIAAWLSHSRQLSIRVKMNNVTYGSEDITSLSFDSGSISGEVFQIGSTYMNSIQMVFPSIIESVAEDLEVIPELGILVNGEYEYTKLGHFYIDEFERNRNSNTTSITATDKMRFMEGPYTSKLVFPKPYREVALEIANLAGVEVNQASFSSLGIASIRKPEGYTHRQAIGLIAQFEGGFASFNRNGELEIRRLAPTTFEITPESYLLKGFSKNEVSYRIGGITVRTGEEETDVISIGSTNGSQVALENKVMTKSLLNQIWDQVKALNYFPYELKWRGCPLLEAGDWINVTAKDGTQYSVPNLSYSITFNGGMSAESKASTSSSSQATYKYRGPLSQRIDYLDSILSSNNWNSNYYDSTEPANPKEGDIWFKPNGQDVEIWIFRNVDGTLKWVMEITSAGDPELLAAIEEAIKAGLDAEEAAGEAKELAEEAKKAGEEAQLVADAAKSAGENAAVLAQQAETEAKLAKEKADAIQIDVNGLVSDIAVINGTVSSISSKANDAYAKATEVEGKTATLETSISGITGRLTDVETSAEGTIKKVNELVITVDGQKQTLATVTTTADSALSKANVIETKVDGVTQTITSIENQLDQIPDGNRNLLLNSSFYTDSDKWGLSSGLNPYFNGQYLRIDKSQTSSTRLTISSGTSWLSGKVQKNKYYSLGIMYYVESVGNAGSSNNIFLRNQLNTGFQDKPLAELDLSITGKWIWLSKTDLSWNEDFTLSSFTIALGQTTIAAIRFKEVILVEGRNVKEWSPAPEDLATVSKVNQIATTVDGTIQTISSVKSTADSALAKATQVETTANGLKTTISSVETTANSALTKATQVESTANGIRQTVSEVQTQLDFTDIKTAIAGGKLLSLDPEFRVGSNGLSVYNNSNNGNVTMTRANVSGDTSPTDSLYRINVTVTGSASPGYGGIVRPQMSRVNAKFIVRFVAMLPSDKAFMNAQNSIGTGGKTTWLTARNGTGKWTEYMYLVECGTEGSFSSFGHLYVTTGGSLPSPENPLRWYLASYEMFDISSSNQSQITQLATDINLKVSQNDVVNQINISNEGILIAGDKIQILGSTYIADAVIKTANINDLAVSNAKIANLAVSEGKIGNLAVTNAKIANLSVTEGKIGDAAITTAKIGNLAVSTAKIADGAIVNAKIGDAAITNAKIQDATIASAKIINIDASKIVANTLAAITTNTGALNISGWLNITTTTGGIAGSFDYTETDAYRPRKFSGEWALSNQTQFFKGWVYTPSGTYQCYAESYFGLDYFKFRQYTQQSKATLMGRVDITGEMIELRNTFNDADDNNGIRLYSDGNAYFNGITRVYGQLMAGNIDADTKRTQLSINYSRDLGRMLFSKDSTGRFILSDTIYNRTYNSQATVCITDAGTLGRIVSARKYKTNIEIASEVVSKAKVILTIQPSSWFDKNEVAQGIAKQRHYGFIADEFHEKGLGEVVIYNSKGEVEGLAYERLSMYQNVILNDHEINIQRLKKESLDYRLEIELLKAKILKLEAA